MATKQLDKLNLTIQSAGAGQQYPLAPELTDAKQHTEECLDHYKVITSLVHKQEEKQQSRPSSSEMRPGPGFRVRENFERASDTVVERLRCCGCHRLPQQTGGIDALRQCRDVTHQHLLFAAAAL